MDLYLYLFPLSVRLFLTPTVCARIAVCMHVYACVYDSCRVQGFRSLLVAITVVRRAGIIALIAWCTCTRARVGARAQLGHVNNACGER